ncbi:MAG: glycoside hydrolase 43 family protein [Alistipes sp.]|nr:glycoside hydrolase 43 family protein [Alistipes sp.]
MKKVLLICGLMAAMSVSAASKVWVSDLGNGKYRNPVLFADYSDPDLIRVGDDYWMTASSFNHTPGLQILHSTDLVNWEIVNAVFRVQEPREHFDVPAHGDGVWAPAIRYHEGQYYIYWGDPDFGIYMTQTDDPRGEWTKPHLVKAGKGMIDTCPLWDDDGKAYLVHGWAGSRATFKSVLSVCEMSPDGRELIGEEVLIFDGHEEHPTVEGPKFYKRNGWYYVFAPAGGVKPGWQIVLRSRSPYGPYECRTVLHQGDTDTPGPHQGGWVDDVEGNSWFMHFVDMYAYGRVVHLQPMTWGDDDWCIIGVDRNGDGIGEPVDTYRKPASNKPVSAPVTPADDDEFDGTTLGLQWQWPANPGLGWYMNNPTDSELRLYCYAPSESWRNLMDTPNLLLQKVVAPEYTITAKVDFRSNYDGDRAGLTVMGLSYAGIGFRRTGDAVALEQFDCIGAKNGAAERVNATVPFRDGEVWLRCRIDRSTDSDGNPSMICTFSYSTDGRKFQTLGSKFVAEAGQWVGAKTGFYTGASQTKNDAAWLDIDWFRLTKK